MPGQISRPRRIGYISRTQVVRVEAICSEDTGHESLSRANARTSILVELRYSASWPRKNQAVLHLRAIRHRRIPALGARNP